MSEISLNRWCVATAALVLLAFVLATVGPPLDSPVGIAFRVVYGLATAGSLIGFNLYLLAECIRRQRGWRRRALVVSFFLFVPLFAFLYYWWFRPRTDISSDGAAPG